MPTTRPRYTVTDTGELATMLDLAHRRWPDVSDRKQLLLRLATVGSEAIALDVDHQERLRRRKQQLDALNRAGDLVDAHLLLADAAWQ